jgi:HAE1 family hydrophobic/amphiphilic exporter-1
MQLDIYGFVALIMLIGIVKKNAIMMVDFALELERKGNYTASESTYQGSMTRFRPIMMTTACAIIGALPIAIGFGADADARRPLGVCVVGGLMFAQFVTLYLTPVFYTYMDAFMKWRHARKREESFEGAAADEQLPFLAPDVKHIAKT